jgi:hypothetical protein
MASASSVAFTRTRAIKSARSNSSVSRSSGTTRIVSSSTGTSTSEPPAHSGSVTGGVLVSCATSGIETPSASSTAPAIDPKLNANLELGLIEMYFRMRCCAPKCGETFGPT